MGKRNLRDVWEIKETLQLFELVSGLKVNIHKISLIGVNNHQEWLERAASILIYKVGGLLLKYLGIPVGGKRFWNPVIDTVRHRLASWNNNYLSIPSRVILLKSVMFVLPIYYISFFKTPSGIISELKSLFKKFL